MVDTTTHGEQTQDHDTFEEHAMALGHDTDLQPLVEPTHPEGGRRRGLVWTVGALAAAVVIAGTALVLTRPSGDSEAATPAPAASTVAASEQQAAIDAAWKSVQTYNTLTDQARQAASIDGIDLASVTDLSQIDDVQRFVADQLAAGNSHQTGTTTVSLISGEYRPSPDAGREADVAAGQVALEVCADSSGADLVDDATGQSVRVPAPGQTEIQSRGVIDYSLNRQGGIWKVTSETVQWNRPC